jgi:1,5-anhydro-D-fructose reductase (1,5-anhydro-D-mannitol-forming)
MGMKKLRWGVVGLGGLVTNDIAPILLDSPGSELVACVGSTLEKAQAFANKFGVPEAYGDMASMLERSAIDVVYIVTPNGRHHTDTLAAARAGKHVLCEKPLALTVSDAQAMIDACQNANVLLRVGFQMRQEQIFRRIRDIVKSGILGELRTLTFERMAPVGPKSAWRKDVVEGGILYDVAVHLLDQAQWLTGTDFEEVSGYSYPDVGQGVAGDTVVITGRLGTTCHAMISASREIPRGRNDLQIKGTEGTLVTTALRWAEEFSLRIETTHNGTITESYPPSNAYRRQIEAFEREAAGGTRELADGADGLASVRLATAIQTSIQTRRSVVL